MAEAKPRKKKTPAEKLKPTVKIGIAFPALDCDGSAAEAKAEFEDGKVKFFQKDAYDDWEEVGKGVEFDVLIRLVELLQESHP